MPWNWYYQPDDPNLAWGGDARLRHVQRQSPLYSLSLTPAWKPPVDKVGALWYVVLQYVDLNSCLQFSETSRGMRELVAIVGSREKLQGFACLNFHPGDPTTCCTVAVGLARQAIAQLRAPPDIAVVVATKPWAKALPALRRAIRAVLPITACSLSTTVHTFLDHVEEAVTEGIAVLALRLPRPMKRGTFPTIAISTVIQATTPCLVASYSDPYQTPDALDLVALVDGDDAEEEEEHDEKSSLILQASLVLRRLLCARRT
mmetsp:Transcript_80942/g.127452  ORF Transcript_80942/g.127452 Transcript_80942/m.127452 type:complete len:260 (+) Transcript_80942:61-840(+)|eukprot:CAMPEP_0169068602 /NCGR_PEP_ID=MMETSP1015-20121227/4107_1 /TAXON_ID=342587 /ORGANISM="Karlodinium micrum, Strain CCMP2283" /LENGTH=259 /DNA_ID=CAMNT_0009127419 /DNA_START=46 /DNA_END=825 /DNA_ORIENTATION=+